MALNLSLGFAVVALGLFSCSPKPNEIGTFLTIAFSMLWVCGIELVSK